MFYQPLYFKGIYSKIEVLSELFFLNQLFKVFICSSNNPCVYRYLLGTANRSYFFSSKISSFGPILKELFICLRNFPIFILLDSKQLILFIISSNLFWKFCIYLYFSLDTFIVMDFKKVDTFILDLDATIWYWTRLIPGARKVIYRLKDLGKKIFYVTTILLNQGEEQPKD